MHGLRDIKMKKLVFILKNTKGKEIEKAELTEMEKDKTAVRIYKTGDCVAEFIYPLGLKEEYGKASDHYFNKIIEGTNLNIHSEEE